MLRRSRTKEEDEVNPRTLAKNQSGCASHKTALPPDTRCNYSELSLSVGCMENERKFLPRSNPQFALPVLAVLQMTETLVLVNKIQNQPGLEISSALYTTVLGFHPKRRSFSITNLPAQPEQQIDRTRDLSARLLSISAMAYNYMWPWSRLFGACSLAVHALLYSGQCHSGLVLARVRVSDNLG